MDVDYKNSEEAKNLATILDEYMEAFSYISMVIAYPEENNISDEFKMPSGLIDWMDMNKSNFDAGNVGSIVDMCKATNSAGASLIEILKQKTKPSYKSFLTFKNSFDSLIVSLSFLGQEGLCPSEVDEVTGLKNVDCIRPDLKKEMDRLSRNGGSFVLAVFRIDLFDQHSAPDEVIAAVVRSIKLSIRPFDDAYGFDDGAFLLSLKNSDMIGCESVARRIRNVLSNSCLLYTSPSPRDS